MIKKRLHEAILGKLDIGTKKFSFSDALKMPKIDIFTCDFFDGRDEITRGFFLNIF